MKKVIVPVLAAVAFMWSIPNANAVTYVCADIYCSSVKPVGATVTGPGKTPTSHEQRAPAKKLPRR